MNHEPIEITTALVRHLIDTQFPQWKGLSIRPVALSGWDNRTFHLGEDMLVRLPSSKEYAAQVEKEQFWLPRLSRQLPLSIPVPLALGEPGEGYPWKWSIYRWIEGDSAASAPTIHLEQLATDLAQFLNALHRINASGGPLPGPHSFFRGGFLSVYDAETRQAITLLKNRIDDVTVTKIWETALATSWQGPPVWVHGDISAGNLLIKNDRLCAVIDFGQLTIGDPACDLAIAWTLFRKESRHIFQATLHLDTDTWNRGRAWALWKALIIAAGLVKSNTVEGTQCWQIIDEIIADYKRGLADLSSRKDT